MNTKSIVLPGLALGLATLLIAPGTESLGSFTLIGSSLSTAQRDFRVFNNYTDIASNNNEVADPEFPGALGAELATWKAVAEWGSSVHGNGGGDPTQGVIGNGGANFDASWSGNSSGIGGSNDNTISAISSCGSGIIAFAEGPYADGWRIRMCDGSWVFADGPANIGGGAFDIQGIVTHEYGHVLGLGHSCTFQATMFASGNTGSVSERSIHFDDIAGIKAIYGVKSASKPLICETSASGGVLTISGGNFDATTNSVWFTNANTTAPAGDPRIIVNNVPSPTGTMLSVTIPGNAAPGDVLVKIPGGSNGSTLSNAFPTDLVGTITNAANCPIIVDSVTPSVVPALSPGLTQDVTLSGTGFSNAIDIVLNSSQSIPSSDWTIVDDSTITVNMPQFAFLTTTTIEVKSSGSSDFGIITIVANTSPAMQLGTGEDFNVAQNGDNLRVVMAGTPGTSHFIYYSISGLPSIGIRSHWLIGNQFSNFFFAVSAVIGNNGWVEFDAPVTFTGPDLDIYSQSIDVTSGGSPLFGVSNLQIFTLTE